SHQHFAQVQLPVAEIGREEIGQEYPHVVGVAPQHGRIHFGPVPGPGQQGGLRHSAGSALFLAYLALATFLSRASMRAVSFSRLASISFSLACFSAALIVLSTLTWLRCLNSSSWRMGSNWSSFEARNLPHCKPASTASSF